MAQYNAEYVKEKGRWKFGYLSWQSRGSTGKQPDFMKDYLKKLVQIGEESRAGE